jgi:hypothetical protein
LLALLLRSLSGPPAKTHPKPNNRGAVPRPRPSLPLLAPATHVPADGWPIAKEGGCVAFGLGRPCGKGLEGNGIFRSEHNTCDGPRPKQASLFSFPVPYLDRECHRSARCLQAAEPVKGGLTGINQRGLAVGGARPPCRRHVRRAAFAHGGGAGSKCSSSSHDGAAGREKCVTRPFCPWRNEASRTQTRSRSFGLTSLLSTQACVFPSSSSLFFRPPSGFRRAMSSSSTSSWPPARRPLTRLVWLAGLLCVCEGVSTTICRWFVRPVQSVRSLLVFCGR